MSDYSFDEGGLYPEAGWADDDAAESGVPYIDENGEIDQRAMEAYWAGQEAATGAQAQAAAEHQAQLAAAIDRASELAAVEFQNVQKENPALDGYAAAEAALALMGDREWLADHQGMGPEQLDRAALREGAQAVSTQTAPNEVEAAQRFMARRRAVGY
jgi:hypothetical protein